MLESLSLSNFRLFESLQIARLGRVNLFSGKNGTGKSCLLEAVHILARDASPELLFDLINWRSEQVPVAQSKYTMPGSELLDNSLRHLFRGHLLPAPLSAGISMGDLANPGKIKIYTQFYKNVLGEHGEWSFMPVSDLPQWDEDACQLHVVSEVNQKVSAIARVGRNEKRFIFRQERLQTKYHVSNVSSRGLPDRQVALLWDKTNLTDLEQEVEQTLRLVHPAINRIAFIELTEVPNVRMPVALMAGTNEIVPLKSLGDGAVRLLHIILALVNAGNGLVLLDEAENGLHWSVQGKLWRIVFRLASRLNIQVFATTHSKDCIEGFHEAWQEYPTEGAFFRMDAEVGVQCTPYSLRTLGNALAARVEMR